MPFLLMRTASVLAAGFLMTGSSYAAQDATSASGPSSSIAARAVPSCPAHWTAGHLPLPQAPTGLYGRIQSTAALSPKDVWIVLAGSDEADVYHLSGATWVGPEKLYNNGNSFYPVSIVASSDWDVWVTGTSATDAPEAWHYDGSAWTDHSPTLSSSAEIKAAALGSNGVLYLAGTNEKTDTGIIWRYDGSRWTDLTPANPPSSYQALAVTASGTIVAAGGGQAGATLQERSGGTWTTVSLPAPGNTSITGVSVAPGGTVS